MWYQYVTIHSETHEIYVHPYYYFRIEVNDSKGFSAVNDANTTRQYLPKKQFTMISDRGGGGIYTALSNEKVFPKYFDTQKFIIRNHYPYGYESLY